MNQLSLFNMNLTKEVKREAEKLMKKYRVLDAIIESRKLDLSPKLTQCPETASESQRGNQFYSGTETLAIARAELEDYERTKKKLALIYESLKPIQQKIWDERYIMDRKDIDVYNDLYIDDNAYYRLKREMVAIVAEAFGMNGHV